MRRTLRPVAFLALLFTALPAPGQHGTIGPADGSKQFLAARGIVVPPVPRTEVTNLVDAGVVECEGFTHLVLNLAVEVKGPVEPGGAVGAILIPDVFPYDRAYRVLQLLPSAGEVGVPLEGSSATLTARQVRMEVGFPRYRVLLWNSGRTAVTASVSVWRTKT
ncbi:MAG TPA: hypothetical protein VMN04_09410 [Thermoanaerobaculia bacterium]|nr:hypothetical protein [Thermoanaerobaculia bacterium]